MVASERQNQSVGRVVKNLLALETSTEVASIALAINGEIFTEELMSSKQHALNILPIIASLLKRADAGIQDLQGIVFGCGPGSFTGLRVSLSVAKGLAYAHNLPLYPVTSLAAIAHSACERNVLALLDARMGQLYFASFAAQQRSYEELVTVADPEKIILADELKDLHVLGVGFAQYLPRLPAAILANIVLEQELYPSAVMMLDLVQNYNIKAVRVADAQPYYVRNNVVG
jgi:tRNA threonylcarbamoyladenosine biosynthesis protein TsaB